MPKEINVELVELKKALEKNGEDAFNDLLRSNLFVKCFGEYAADQDELDRIEISYYSAGTNLYHNFTRLGLIPHYYYPYLNQPGYEQPLVFVQFNRLPNNRLLNVVCKAFAKNVDSSDKLNMRGMTLFQFYVEK